MTPAWGQHNRTGAEAPAQGHDGGPRRRRRRKRAKHDESTAPTDSSTPPCSELQEPAQSPQAGPGAFDTRRWSRASDASRARGADVPRGERASEEFHTPCLRPCAAPEADEYHSCDDGDLGTSRPSQEARQPRRLTPPPRSDGRVSTAIFPNRVRDKAWVEQVFRLDEFPSDAASTAPVRFYVKRMPGTCIAIGYVRVIYGDHGPYLELREDQVTWDYPAIGYARRKPDYAYYDEYDTADRSVMIYAQKRRVDDKPNPPWGPRSVNNNCPEGYADYRPGYFYISLDPATLEVRHPGEPEPSPRPGRRERRWRRGRNAE